MFVLVAGFSAEADGKGVVAIHFIADHTGGDLAGLKGLGRGWLELACGEFKPSQLGMVQHRGPVLWISLNQLPVQAVTVAQGQADGLGPAHAGNQAEAEKSSRGEESMHGVS